MEVADFEVFEVMLQATMITWSRLLSHGSRFAHPAARAGLADSRFPATMGSLYSSIHTITLSEYNSGYGLRR
jgi:hypothetical protein